MFAPVLFVTVGFDITFDVFADSCHPGRPRRDRLSRQDLGSWLFALPTSLTSREGLVIGFGMNGRDTVEIIIASVALSAGLIDTELFSILEFIAIFTTALAPVTVTWDVRMLERADELVYVEWAGGSH